MTLWAMRLSRFRMRSVANAVLLIFGGCSIPEIDDVIIERIPVVMADMRPLGLRADECLCDEGVYMEMPYIAVSGEI